MSTDPKTGFKSAQHEFSDEDNRTISGLAQSMGTFATLMQLMGLVFVIFCGLQATTAIQTQSGYAPVVGLGVAALLCLTIGFWTSGSAKSFRRIAESKNEDVWHLMNALRTQHNMYSLLRTIILGGLVLAVVGLTLAAISMARG